MNKLRVIYIKDDNLLSCAAHLSLNPSHPPLDNLHSHSLLIYHFNRFHPPDSCTFSSFSKLHFSMIFSAAALTLPHF
jgi:hypothetical protein